MYIAMPLQERALANHFTKANTFALFDQQGTLVKQFDNPALEKGCEGKSKLIELFHLYQVSQVVVKNIGERMLGKLIDSNIVVKQANQRGVDVLSVFSQLERFPLLTDAEQGRESVNYREKQQSGGCCHHGHDHQPKMGDAHSHSAAEHKQGRCCGQKSGEPQSHQHIRGKGRCGQH
jgi:predicted Fe-Mo cluster-binding NifX family protein